MEKKNQYIWFFYACAVLFGFSKTTATLTHMMGLPVQAYLLLTAALIFAVLLLVYLPVKLLAGKRGWLLGEWEYERKMTLKKWVLLMLLLEVLLCVRLYGTPAGISVDDHFCYQEALKLTERPRAGFGMGELYILFLHFCIRVFGGTYAAFWGNMILQALGAAFLFLTVQGLTGTVAACCGVLSVACIPAFHHTTYGAEPQSMVFCMYALILFLGSLCLKLLRNRKGKAGIRLLRLASAAGGFAAAADLSFAGAWLMTGAGLVFVLKSAKKKRKALPAFVFWGILGFSLFFFLEYLAEPEGGTLLQELSLFWSRWSSPAEGRIYDALLHSPTLADYWAVIPLYLFSFLALFGKEREVLSSGAVWILPMICALGIDVLGQAPYQEQGIFFALLGIAAGTGLTQMISSQDISEETAADKLLEDEFEFVAEDEEESQEVPAKQLIDAETQTQSAVCGGIAMKEEIQKPKPGEYLDNPLPVPKRHVKREMDYGFEPDPDQMFFEIPVSDEDDFDLK